MQRAQEGDAAGHLGRKELEEIEAMIECRYDLGGRRDTGNDEDLQPAAALDDARS